MMRVICPDPGLRLVREQKAISTVIYKWALDSKACAVKLES